MRLAPTFLEKNFWRPARRRTLLSAFAVWTFCSALAVRPHGLSRSSIRSVVESDEPLRLDDIGADNAPRLRAISKHTGHQAWSKAKPVESEARPPSGRPRSDRADHPQGVRRAVHLGRTGPPCCWSRQRGFAKRARARSAREAFWEATASSIAQLRLQARGVNPLSHMYRWRQ